MYSAVHILHISPRLDSVVRMCITQAGQRSAHVYQPRLKSSLHMDISTGSQGQSMQDSLAWCEQN